MSAETVAADPAVRRVGLTREQFDRLVGPDSWDGDPVELLEGVLVAMVPQGWEHADAVRLLDRWLSRRVPDPWFVDTQLPFAAGARSQPEPDVAVVRRQPGGHPVTAALVLEVATSSQRLDLVHKPRIYAAAGVPVYWVVDLPAREVVVHAEPSDAGYVAVERLPWSAPLRVRVDDVDVVLVLADVLTDLG